MKRTILLPSVSKAMTQEYDYDVALSFAGEDRAYVYEVASMLRDAGIKVFYDDFSQTELWGKNLYVYLRDIYQSRAKYTVMFVSKHYAEKRWPSHERESAQARAFEESREYILPARFDDTSIPGMAPTTGYVDLRLRRPAELAGMILEKLRDVNSSSDRWSDPKQAFIMHAATKGSINLEYTVTKRRNVRELLRGLSKGSAEREYFNSDTVLDRTFRDGWFNVWGVPRGASPSFDRTQIGDLVLFVGQLSEDAAIKQLGIVKAKCPIECPNASRLLWPEAPPDKSYPLLFFFDTEVGSRPWLEFKTDIDDVRYNPRGWYKQIGNERFRGFGGPSGYLRFLRQVCGFNRMHA
jgi:hypothetical protein